MRYARTTLLFGSLLIGLCIVMVVATNAVTQGKAQSISQSDVNKILSGWKNQEAAQTAHKLIDKYGMPDEMTDRRLIWHNNGLWKRTEIEDMAVPHNYPNKHVDFLKQVVSYRVTIDKASDCYRFDGAVQIDVIPGELGSRCDEEEANFFITNLAVEIMEGKRTWQDAHTFYAESLKNKTNQEYGNRLLFKPYPEDQARNPGTTYKT